MEARPPLLTPLCNGVSLSGISSCFHELSRSYRQVTHVLLTRPPLSLNQIDPKASMVKTSLDLHVLGTPPAFVLSQDQTLHKKFVLLYKQPSSLFLTLTRFFKNLYFASVQFSKNFSHCFFKRLFTMIANPMNKVNFCFRLLFKSDENNNNTL